MSKFEILCVTMYQKDFSKINEMNIHSNVILANQADETFMKKIEFDGCVARMVSTTTRGVGVNRNTALMHAQGEVCIFADDDVVYSDDMEKKVLAEFDKHPDADIIIFHFETDDIRRKQKMYKRTRKSMSWEQMPWAGFRIAFRLDSVKKANLWFNTLFGGGCIFPSGEDSIWLLDAKRKGLKIYVSKETIGKVSFDTSTWFTGFDEKFYYGKGAFYEAVHPKMKYFWIFYMAVRTYKYKEIDFWQKILWMQHGTAGYKKLLDYFSYKKKLVAIN